MASGAKSNTNPISIAGAIWNLCPQICEPVSRSPKPTRYASDYKPRRLASFNSKLNKTKTPKTSKAENHEDEEGKEEKEPLSEMNDQGWIKDGKLDFLIKVQAWELPQQCQKEKIYFVLLNKHLKDLLSHSDLDNYQGQGFWEQLAEGHRVAECLAWKLSPETMKIMKNKNPWAQGATEESEWSRARPPEWTVFNSWLPCSDCLQGSSQKHCRMNLKVCKALGAPSDYTHYKQTDPKQNQKKQEQKSFKISNPTFLCSL